MPPRLKIRDKRLRREIRRIERKNPNNRDYPRLTRLYDLESTNWRAIRRALVEPAKPAGLEVFLEKAGL